MSQPNQRQIQEALVMSLLYWACEYENESVREREFMNAALAYFKLLELEGVNLNEIALYDSGDARACAVDEAISNAVISGMLFRKTRHDGMVHFEHYFKKWAEGLMTEIMTAGMLEASRNVKDLALQALFGASESRVIYRYHEMKKIGIAAAT